MDQEDFSGFLLLINDCDSDAPLLSQTNIGDCISRIPLECVPASDLNCLTLSLSVEQLIPTDSGLRRDYRGMGELMGFTSAAVETRFRKTNNSTKSLIDAYIYRGSQAGSADNRISLNDLLKIIEQIERFDVIDDFLPTLVEWSSRKTTNQIRDISLNSESIPSRQLRKDMNRLTFDDTPDNATKYDAFISYAPQDSDEAQDLKSELQNRGKRVATADDMLPGHFEHDALMQLIDLRCRKVIIIVTRNFLSSEECKFQLRFASEVAIKGNNLKIIPVLYEKIPDELLPGMIKYTSKLNFNDQFNSRTMQFDKLIRSLECSARADHDKLDYRPSQSPNGRTSSFNNRLGGTQFMALESNSVSSNSNSYSGHRVSNGLSPFSTGTNEPYVELSHSRDSSEIMNHSAHNISAGRKITVINSYAADDSFSSNFRKWSRNILSFLPKKRADSRAGVSHRDSCSFASESLLISADSRDLSKEDKSQNHEFSQ